MLDDKIHVYFTLSLSSNLLLIYLHLKSVLFQCPRDMRLPLSEGVLLFGGTAMLPGLKYRLAEEVTELLKNNKYADKLNFEKLKVYKPPCADNFTAWLGGSYYFKFRLRVGFTKHRPKAVLSGTEDQSLICDPGNITRTWLKKSSVTKILDFFVGQAKHFLC